MCLYKKEIKMKDCMYQGKSYSSGKELCIGDQCLNCNDGNWEPKEFEVGYRERNQESL